MKKTLSLVLTALILGSGIAMAEQRIGRPCPYCGGVPYLYRQSEHVTFISAPSYVQYKYLVRCPECGCTTHWYEDEQDAFCEFYEIERA